MNGFLPVVLPGLLSRYVLHIRTVVLAWLALIDAPVLDPVLVCYLLWIQRLLYLKHPRRHLSAFADVVNLKTAHGRSSLSELDARRSHTQPMCSGDVVY